MTSIVVIVCLTLVYTYEGGLTAVIWTDVVQMILYVIGAVLSFYIILDEIPGGWSHVVAVAAPLGKFQVFDFRLAPPAIFFTRTYSFWAGVIGGCFLTTASHGTEQLMVQRLLAAPTERQSRAALVRQLGGHLHPVHAVPGHRHLPLRPLFRQPLETARRAGQDLSAVYLAASAGGNLRTGHRGDFGRRHVQPQRGAEFAGIDHGDGFSEALVARRQSPMLNGCAAPAMRPCCGERSCSASR